MDAERCTALADVSYTNFTLSLLILLGMLISYLPQHIRIISRRSSFGISPYFVLLGTASSTCAFANILNLPTSRADIACCHVVNGFACFAGLLGIAQVGVQWSCFTIILLLYLIFFPRATPSSPAHPDKDDGPTYRTALAITGISILHAIITVIISSYFIFTHPEHLQGWANFLGILATVLGSIQYFPQIYTTYHLKRVGSLSIPMMCIQTPGSFVWAGSLVARYGAGGWSTWGICIVTGTLQGTLLVMGIYFEIMHRRREKYEIEDRLAAARNESQDLSEETPLLRSED